MSIITNTNAVNDIETRSDNTKDRSSSIATAPAIRRNAARYVWPLVSFFKADLPASCVGSDGFQKSQILGDLLDL